MRRSTASRSRALADAGALERLRRVELKGGRGYDVASATALAELLAEAALAEIVVIDEALMRVDFLDALFATITTTPIEIPGANVQSQRYATMPNVRLR